MINGSLSVDSTDEDTYRCAADDPGENQEDSRHQTLSKCQKGELKKIELKPILVFLKQLFCSYHPRIHRELKD